MRNLQISLLSTAALAFLIAPNALAQQEQSAGFGQMKRSWNMTELAGTLPDSAPDGNIRGVVAIDGLLYVSGRNGGSSDEHRIYIVDPSSEPPTLMGHFPVPEPHASSSRGAYDMAKDMAGNILAGGDEGVAVFDRSGNQLGSILTPGGPVEIPKDDDGHPVLGNQGGALDQMAVGGRRHFAGVAFDPDGDFGNGSVWVAQGLDAGDFLEIRLADAAVARRYESASDSDGLAIDPLTGTLWNNSSADNTEGIVELDIANATDDDDDGEWDIPETGRIIQRLFTDFASGRGRTNGGLDFMTGGDPGPAPLFGGAFDMVSVSVDNYASDGDDWVSIHRVHLFTNVPGHTESFLGSSTGMRDIQNFPPTLYGAGDTLNWGMVSNGRPNLNGPALDIINFGSDATQDGVSFLPGVGLFPELVALSFASQPAALVTVTQPTTVGDGTLASATSITLPPTFGVTTSDTIRIQTVYFEPASSTMQLAASNETWFLGLDIRTILFEMDAPTAYHVDLVNPYIRLSEFGGGGAETSIVKLIIDVQTTDLLENRWFDTVTGAMFDIFAAGNGQMYGCTGTYREGSDVAVGLIYSADDTVNTIINLGRDDATGRDFEGAGYPACFVELWPDPTATEFPYQGGYLATNPDDPNDTDPDWYPDTLEFNFTPGMFLGQTFKFDLDIDGGPDSGRDMAGTYVEVHLQDGTVLTGVTFPDDTALDRSITGW